MLIGRFIVQIHFECFFPRATKASEEVATMAEALGASLMQTPFLERHLMLLRQTMAVFNSQFQVILPESQQHTVGASYLALCAAYFDTVKTSIESGMTDRDYTQHFRQTVSDKIRQVESKTRKR